MILAVTIALYVVVSIYIFFLYRDFRVSSINIFIGAFYCFVVTGFFVLSLGLDDGRLNRGVYWDNYLFFGFVISIFILVFFILIKIFLDGVIVKSKADLVIYYSKASTNLISIFLILLISFFLFSIERPIYYLFSDGIAEAYNIRQGGVDVGTFGRLFQKFLNVFAVIWPIYLYSLIKLGYKKIGIFDFLLFVFVFIYLVSGLSKGGVVYLMISIFLIGLLVNDRNMSIVTAIKSVVFVIIFASLLIILLMPRPEDEAWYRPVLSTLSRIFSGQVEPAYHLFRWVSDNGYVYGASLPNPRGVFPWEYLDIEFIAWQLMYPERAAAGLAFKNPTAFWVEGYVNFGIVGILVFTIFVAFIFIILEFIYAKVLCRNLLLTCLYLWLVIHYVRLSTKSLSFFIIDMELFFSVVVVSLIYLVFYFCRAKCCIKNYR